MMTLSLECEHSLYILCFYYSFQLSKMTTPPPDDPTPTDDGAKDEPSPEPAEPSPSTPFERYKPLIHKLVDAQKEMRIAFMEQLIKLSQQNTQLTENSIHLHRQVVELGKRVHCLQDWMMSPFRIVPLNTLQEHFINIDDLQTINAETPSDENPWSVQLLELLDRSILHQFPKLDFTPLDFARLETPQPPRSEASTEDFHLEDQPQNKPEEVKIEVPSPVDAPGLPSLVALGLEEPEAQGPEVPSPTVPTPSLEDPPQEELSDVVPVVVFEVQDSPAEIPPEQVLPGEDQVPVTRSVPPDTWQTVPTSEIDNTSLPSMLEPPSSRKKRRVA